MLGLGGLVRHWLGLRLSPGRDGAAVVCRRSGAGGAQPAGVRLAAAAGRRRRRSQPPAETFAHGLVVAALAVNVSLVGVAFGAYGTRLLPYVPQLPLGVARARGRRRRMAVR